MTVRTVIGAALGCTVVGALLFAGVASYLGASLLTSLYSATAGAGLGSAAGWQALSGGMPDVAEHSSLARALRSLHLL